MSPAYLPAASSVTLPRTPGSTVVDGCLPLLPWAGDATPPSRYAASSLLTRLTDTPKVSAASSAVSRPAAASGNTYARFRSFWFNVTFSIRTG